MKSLQPDNGRSTLPKWKNSPAVMMSSLLHDSLSQGAGEAPAPAADSVDVIPGSQLLWRVSPRPANSAQVSTQRSLTPGKVVTVFVISAFSFSLPADVQLHVLRHAAE